MKKLTLVTILLLAFSGIGAIYGGWHLVSDPTGKSIGLPTDFLEHSPFRTYFIPGILLFVINGIFSFITIGSVLSKSRRFPLHVALQGMVLVGWILIQVSMLRFLFFLHFVMGATGIALIVLSVLLTIKRRQHLKAQVKSQLKAQ